MAAEVDGLGFEGRREAEAGEEDEVDVASVLRRVAELHSGLSNAIERCLRSSISQPPGVPGGTWALAPSSSSEGESSLSSWESGRERARQVELRVLLGARDALEELEAQLELYEVSPAAHRDLALHALEERRRRLALCLHRHPALLAASAEGGTAPSPEHAVVLELLAFIGEDGGAAPPGAMGPLKESPGNVGLLSPGQQQLLLLDQQQKSKSPLHLPPYAVPMPTLALGAQEMFPNDLDQAGHLGPLAQGLGQEAEILGCSSSQETASLGLGHASSSSSVLGRSGEAGGVLMGQRDTGESESGDGVVDWGGAGRAAKWSGLQQRQQQQHWGWEDTDSGDGAARKPPARRSPVKATAAAAGATGGAAEASAASPGRRSRTRSPAAGVSGTTAACAQPPALMEHSASGGRAGGLEGGAAVLRGTASPGSGRPGSGRPRSRGREAAGKGRRAQDGASGVQVVSQSGSSAGPWRSVAMPDQLSSSQGCATSEHGAGGDEEAGEVLSSPVRARGDAGRSGLALLLSPFRLAGRAVKGVGQLSLRAAQGGGSLALQAAGHVNGGVWALSRSAVHCVRQHPLLACALALGAAHLAGSLAEKKTRKRGRRRPKGQSLPSSLAEAAVETNPSLARPKAEENMPSAVFKEPFPTPLPPAPSELAESAACGIALGASACEFPLPSRAMETPALEAPASLAAEAQHLGGDWRHQEETQVMKAGAATKPVDFSGLPEPFPLGGASAAMQAPDALAEGGSRTGLPPYAPAPGVSTAHVTIPSTLPPSEAVTERGEAGFAGVMIRVSGTTRRMAPDRPDVFAGRG